MLYRLPLYTVTRMSPRPKWDEERTLEQLLRRRARDRGLEFTKQYGGSVWFLYDRENRAPRARVFYSLNQAAAVLSDDVPGAG